MNTGICCAWERGEGEGRSWGEGGRRKGVGDGGGYRTDIVLVS